MPCKQSGPGPIFLVGYRCTGKSTVGRLLAKALSCPFMDTDQAVEAMAGRTISQLVEKRGWEAFRSMETRCLAELPLDGNPVVATGGGIVLAGENREMLKSCGIVIWLKADPATIIRRMLGDQATQSLRPNLTNDSLETETEKMLEIRDPLYGEVSQFALDTAGDCPEKCVQFILRRLDQ